MPNDDRQAGDSQASHDSRDVDDLCYDAPAGGHATGRAADTGVERRQAPRLKYEADATLESVTPNGPNDVRVVTRDADSHGAGFTSVGGLPEGSRAVLHLPDPNDDGQTQRIECRVRRSREIGNGLFEGSVEFLGDQPQFSETRIKFTPTRR